MRKRTHLDEDIFEAVKNSHSFRETMNVLRKKTPGGNYNTLKNRIDTLKLDTSHFTGKAWKRGKTVIQDSRLSKYTVDEIFSENSPTSSSEIRRLILKNKLKQYECEICKIGEWRNQPISLELDHINGNRKDHRIESIRWLCPNCHSQTLNWRGKNKKSYRKYSDSVIIDALKSEPSIRSAIIKVGLSPKGGNYKRFSNLKSLHNL